MSLPLVCLIYLSSQIEATDHLDQILQQHAATIGSLEAWRALDSITYQLVIKEPGFQVEGVYRVKRSGKMRIDIFSEGRQVFTEAYNGELGWQWQPTQESATIIGEQSAAALRHGIELPGHLYTLLDMEDQGHRLEYLGRENHGDNDGHLLRLTLKDGHVKFYVLEVATGLILATRDTRAFHPDIDPEKVLVESRPSDYREVGDMNRPHRGDNWDLTNDQWLGTTLIESVEIDAPIDDRYFEPQNFVALPIE